MSAELSAVRRLLARHGYPARSVRLLGDGLGHAAYEVDGDLVVRLTGTGPVAQVVREADLLHAVAAVAPLPVPMPVLVDGDAGCLAYRKLPGRPLLEDPDPAAHAVSVGVALGTLLAALHTQLIERWAALVDADDTAPADWLAEAQQSYSAVADHLGPTQDHVRAFLSTAPPAPAQDRALCHNDLGIEHASSTRPPGKSPASSTGPTPRSPTRPPTSPRSTATSAHAASTPP
ncbi:aminoglycoside phosphotransferase family protein [Georgenia sp. TF02-10]|uniref:phosphotransferase family protein n=1 Tax=Georgenia sp. TF02-10 TaxID=2917725 RepID=UPI001FA753D7|nr:aminoglycoside phosphotransferase family protein [Georgenia sp. TF02-10]UNX54646.1 aminoglycoside phosphotransferase family protein [Georgenia sp. TF02-10]